MSKSPRIQILFLCFLITSISADLRAQEGEADSVANAPFGFYASVAAKAAFGDSGTDGSAVKSRDHYLYAVEGLLGFHYGMYLFGLTADYGLWRQKTKPSRVSNTNMSGTQLSYGPLFGLALGDFLLGVKLPVSSELKLSKKSYGESVTYKTPEFPAYALQVKYRLDESTFIGLEYASTTYARADVGGRGVKLSSRTSVTYSSWGLMYGLQF